MLENMLIWLGTIAFVWTVLTLIAAAWADPMDSSGDALAMIGGVVGFVLWGVWTFGTLDITVVSQGSELTFAHSELTFLGVVMALVPGYIALTGPIELINRARKPGAEDI